WSHDPRRTGTRDPSRPRSARAAPRPSTALSRRTTALTPPASGDPSLPRSAHESHLRRTPSRLQTHRLRERVIKGACDRGAGQTGYLPVAQLDDGPGSVFEAGHVHGEEPAGDRAREGTELVQRHHG